MDNQDNPVELQPPPQPYTQQPYPEQPRYPQQPHPQQPHPQQPHPQQLYPQQPHPQQGFTAEAPPPYSDGQPTSQQSQNVVVTQPQPQAVATPVYVPNNSRYAIGAFIFAVVISTFLLTIGCCHATICGAVGIALAAHANSSATRGDMKTAKQMQGASFGCTVAALVVTLVSIIALIILEIIRRT